MSTPQYRYDNAQPTWANAYLWPVVQQAALRLSLKEFEGGTPHHLASGFSGRQGRIVEGAVF